MEVWNNEVTKRYFITQINKLYKERSKLAAVKLVWDATNLGLKESKEFVDENFYKIGRSLPGGIMYSLLINRIKL